VHLTDFLIDDTRNDLWRVFPMTDIQSHHVSVRRTGRRASLLFVSVLAASVTLPVLAQGRPGEPPRGGQWGERIPGGIRGAGQGGGEGFRGNAAAAATPDILRRDLVLISRELGLDRAQQQIAELLVLDYEAAFSQAMDARRSRMTALREEQFGDAERREAMQALRDEMRAAMQSLRDRRSNRREEGTPVDADSVRQQIDQLRERMQALRPAPEAMEAMRQAIDESQDELRRNRERILAEFMSDLQLILNDEQMTRWESFERALRRERLISQGTFAGEAVDLFIVLREIGLSGDALFPFQETLDGYAAELDSVLQDRRRVLEADSGAVMAAMREQDAERARQLLEREAQARVRVRDVNERYADLLETELVLVLNADVAERFRSQLNQRAYPRIFQPTRATRAFNAAIRLEEIDGRMIPEVIDLRDRYEVELAIMNQELIGVLRREDVRQPVRRVEQFMAMRDGGAPLRRGGAGAEDPTREAFGRRTALDRRYLDDLRAIIGDDLFAQLPIGREMQQQDIRQALEDALGGELPAGVVEWMESERGQQMMERLGAFLQDGNMEMTPEMIDRIRGMLQRRPGAERGERDGARRGEDRGGRDGARRGEDRGVREGEAGEQQRRPRRDRGGPV